MRTEADTYRYRETLVHYRERAKATIANAQPNSRERGEAIKLFYRCDGAIQILNWIMGSNTELDLPPIIAQREIG